MTTSVLATFENEKNYSSPTEVIEISKIKTIKSDDNTNSFIFVTYGLLIRILNNQIKLRNKLHFL